MSGYTVFISYQLISMSGYSTAIHCNYIKKVDLFAVNPYLHEIFIDFPEEFIFLNDSVSGGTGFTAQKLYILAQIVENSGFTSTSEIKPNPALWKVYDVTSQTSGGILTKAGIANTIYKISLYSYETMPDYNLDYLNYPVALETNKLHFGDEVYFFGNVTTDIKADVYTTDIPISLLLNEFNSSTNPTWDGVSSVAITEIGIYDENKNLVAIGKLNNPIIKDSTISRTIAFAIDF